MRFWEDELVVCNENNPKGFVWQNGIYAIEIALLS
jgi:hypothetical protein